MDLAPLQELGLHVSFGVDLPCVDQGCGRLLVVSISQTLGVVDVVGRLPDPPLSLLDGLAEAGVEAVPLQVALPCVVAAHQACPSYLWVEGFQHPEASGAL